MRSTSSAADLVVLDAAQLVTVGRGATGPRRGGEQSKMEVVEHASMWVSDGRIRAVGPTAEVTGRLDLSAVEVIDARGRIVLPGLIDAHTHALFAGERVAEYAQRLEGRSRAEIEATGGGIGQTVRMSRAATDAELLAGLDAFLARMPPGGVTTVEVKSGYGLTTEEELRQLRLIDTAASAALPRVVPTFLGAHVVPDEFDRSAPYVELITREMLPAVAAQGIARALDASCATGLFSTEQCAQMLHAAAEAGLAGHLHADARGDEHGWRTAAACGAASADHLIYTDADEIDDVGSVRTAAVLAPHAELVYGTPRRADARRFIANGVPVVISSDYCSSIAAPSLYHVLPFAAAWYRMTPEEVINAATINAAHALGLGNEIGSLEPGKSADFTIIDVSDYRALVYDFGECRVQRTYVSGQPAFLRDGR